MPPVHRHHTGLVLVPVDLLAGIDSLYDLTSYPNEGNEYQFGCDDHDPDFRRRERDAAADMTRLVTVPRLYRSTRDVVVDATLLSIARNRLDIDTLNSDSDHGDQECPCSVYCEWCQMLLLRDWCDQRLDTLGQEKSAWIEDIAEDMAATWRNWWAADPEGGDG